MLTANLLSPDCGKTEPPERAGTLLALSSSLTAWIDFWSLVNLAAGPAAGAAGGPNRTRAPHTHRHTNSHVGAVVLLLLVVLERVAHRRTNPLPHVFQPDNLSSRRTSLGGPLAWPHVTEGSAEDIGDTCPAVGNVACHRERLLSGFYKWWLQARERLVLTVFSGRHWITVETTTDSVMSLN